MPLFNLGKQISLAVIVDSYLNGGMAGISSGGGKFMPSRNEAFHPHCNAEHERLFDSKFELVHPSKSIISPSA
ncbi:hypothetical protein HY989_04420 [Candidatus Micrarchaeota archaeon]|nr:hypothetical protein [Candidatus Micrarchaeota archaeon]